MGNVWLAIRLALHDWLHERTITLCAVLALASMLTPIFILQGVRSGVISGMRERLLQDPSVLVITPVSGPAEGSYTRASIARLAGLKGARFVIGRTREIASDISLRKDGGPIVPVHMEPCAEGEPVLEHHGIRYPEDGEIPQIVLSERAARKLAADRGDVLLASLGRKNHEGRFESVVQRFTLVDIVPGTVSDRILGFLPHEVLEDIQDYRDDLAVGRRAWSGRPRTTERTYASFRLYAEDLDAVAGLEEQLAGLGIEARTKAREISAIQSLESALNRIILIISVAVGAGFVAFMVSSTQGSMRRKQRMLGMLRLLGFSRSSLSNYPLFQTLLTAVCGILVAFGAYLLVSSAIDHTFADQSAGLALCRLTFTDFCTTSAAVILLSSLSSLRSAARAAAIDPSKAIREV